MAGEQPIRLKRSLTLRLDDHTFSPLARTRYSSLGLSSTTTLSATPVTPVVRPVKSLSLGHYLGSPNKFLLICSIEISSIDAHLVHHFIDELSPIVVLPPLTIGSSINQSMKDIEKGSEREHNAEGKGSSRSDLEVVGVTLGTRLIKEFYVNLTEEFGNLENPAYSEVYVRALDPLKMPKNIALGVVPPSQTPSTQGHIVPGRATRQQSSKKKHPITKLASPSPPSPKIEVILRFNGVEDLKRFKIKQFVPRESLEELKGFDCAVYKGSFTDSALKN
ncbi:hypothetical protein M9H77_02660 [Catharanthus roseus]|uniref:Uncharacterized protein n=1 Tax=Catharanthus roseus TaxID=4058 RepID=A0ACC0C9B0_CATRO|nr:hypothetical protein M9H77_02660 [Catharanthus roseus]